MINWILLATRSPAPSSYLSAPPSLFLSHFPSPSPPAGPLASRRGDRIISEAFARFLPPSASLVLFLPARRGVLNNCNWTRSQQPHLQRSRSSPLARSLPSPTSVRVSSRVLSLPPALLSPLSSCTVFPSALPTLQYTLSICLLRSEKMKKGGVAREIKGCRRRCLHHPTPTSGGEGREGSEKEESRRRRGAYTLGPVHARTPPHRTPHRARTRCMVCTPHAKLAASYQGPRANHANALRYSG